MSSTFRQFKGLHQSAGLFVLPNAWDAKSAFLFQEKKFPAIATSSAAVASSLGFEDGEEMSFQDYLFVIKRIVAAVKVPVSVDLEMGYGNTVDQVYSNILQLIDLGVVGINMEDSTIGQSGRVLKDAKIFAQTIETIKNKLDADNLELFINIRCDSFLLNVQHKQQETSQRLKLYEATGADGIFLPCISAKMDIAEVVNTTKLPLNVMCVPGLPDFGTLNDLGVKRVSMGPFLFNKVYSYVDSLSQAVTADQSFSPIFL